MECRLSNFVILVTIFSINTFFLSNQIKIYTLHGSATDFRIPSSLILKPSLTPPLNSFRSNSLTIPQLCACSLCSVRREFRPFSLLLSEAFINTKDLDRRVSFNKRLDVRTAGLYIGMYPLQPVVERDDFNRCFLWFS